MALLLQVEISEPDQVASAERAIQEATNAIREYCRQWLHPVTDATVTFDVLTPRYNLLLPQLPVVAITSVLENGVTLTAPDDYTVTQDGQLLRHGGGRWTRGAGAVVVSYSYGYATLPEIIGDIATRAACRVFQAGLRTAQTEAVPGVNAQTLGDFSVTFGAESYGGVSEGVMGVSAARMLLLSEKDMLNAYRL